MKKKLIAIIFIVFILMLIPIKLEYKDGGSVEYRAILYSVTDVHKIKYSELNEIDYYEGRIIKILGLEVYNNVK